MKSYTDLKQSKKLSEILPVESADMHYNNASIKGVDYVDAYRAELMDYNTAQKVLSKYLINPIFEIIPCWSLASLLDALPDKICLNNETYHLNYDKNEVKYLGHMTWDGQKCITSKANNIIDSCYEMIIKLYEQKLL